MNEIKHYWINTEKSQHRRAFMELQYQLTNTPNERINAVTPETLDSVLHDQPPYYCGNVCCTYSNNRDCPYEYACTCSHLEAIRKGYLSNEPYFIVCEDDIFFPFKLNYETLIETLPDNWDILQMMVLDTDKYNELYHINYKTENKLFVKYQPFNKLFSTGMYLISHQGAGKMLHIYQRPIDNKYELCIMNIIKQADFILYMSVNTYTATIPFCMPYLRFISDIHPHHFNIHKTSIEKIIEVLNDILNNSNDLPLKNIISNKYNFNEFDALYISYIQSHKNE